MGSGSNELYLLQPGNYFFRCLLDITYVELHSNEHSARLSGGLSVVLADAQAVTTESKRQGLV